MQTVGAFIGRPHFGENALESPKEYTNSKSKIKTLTSDHSAITLIALIITIIVMLILVAVTVTVAINGGLFSTAKQATTETQYQADREMLLSAVIGAINKDVEVDFEKLDANLPNGFIGTDGEYKSKDGNAFYVNKNGNIIKPVTVTVGTETVMLTPKNVGQYLGKLVTNYTGKSSITIGGSESYTVSPTYRLYYIDFDNKYGNGEGTIYLKAECTENKYQLPTTDTTASTDSNVKIRNLNPELYKNGNPPASTNPNMQAVTWLTNTNNWSDLKPETLSDGITDEDFNYIVGTPSLEMMMDSYNTHYNLSGDEPSMETADSPIVKLFYKYPYNNNRCGYVVGPSISSTAEGGYGYNTSSCVISPLKESGEDIGTLYYPGDNNSYFLSSPPANDIYSLFDIEYGKEGYGWICGSTNYMSKRGLCPLVSLKPTANLKLQ